ncbi:MAG: hypothetical protein ACRD4Q_00055, partial [Candidatus Acidiferrales bacterium]
PLPVLANLAPSPDVYVPASDDFNLLPGISGGSYDTLQSLLDSTTDPAVAASGSLGTTLDSMGAIFDGIDGTFSQLDSSLSQLSYEQEITDTLAIDNAFASNVNNWVPDLGDAIGGFLADISSALDSIFKDILNAIGSAVGVLFADLKSMFIWIWQEIFTAIDLANAAIGLAISALAEIAFLGGTSGEPITIGTGF